MHSLILSVWKNNPTKLWNSYICRASVSWYWQIFQYPRDRMRLMPAGFGMHKGSFISSGFLTEGKSFSRNGTVIIGTAKQRICQYWPDSHRAVWTLALTMLNEKWLSWLSLKLGRLWITQSYSNWTGIHTFLVMTPIRNHTHASRHKAESCYMTDPKFFPHSLWIKWWRNIAILFQCHLSTMPRNFKITCLSSALNYCLSTERHITLAYSLASHASSNCLI